VDARRFWDCSSGKLPVREHVFRPMVSRRMAFKEKPYSSAALNSAYKKAMREAGVYSGHTPHSTKRGSLQAEKAAGKEVPELLQDACMHNQQPAMTGSGGGLQATPLGAVGGVSAVHTALANGILVRAVQRCT